MPLETTRSVTPSGRTLSLPDEALVGQNWYLVDAPGGGQMFVTGVELRQLPAPVKIHSIAWRV